MPVCERGTPGAQRSTRESEGRKKRSERAATRRPRKWSPVMGWWSTTAPSPSLAVRVHPTATSSVPVPGHARARGFTAAAPTTAHTHCHGSEQNVIEISTRLPHGKPAQSQRLYKLTFEPK
ncbi:hypothetical protein B0H13DRAFT_1887478 [Mycena leptocephala]|nr:hypothetical protein B0H13DRAFT_1887478 [Mycena leptocephala]